MTEAIAGKYELKEFVINSLTPDRQTAPRDLKNQVHSWTLIESIKRGNIYGSATIYDATGIFYDFPLKGQELLDIVYTDTKGVERREELFIYSISDVSPANDTDDNMLQYRIDFVSWGKFYSDRFNIRRSFSNGDGSHYEIHKQVQQLFDDYYKGRDGKGTRKTIEITDTVGEQKVVIPNLKPEDAMHMFSRRAYSEDYKSQSYRFFENRNGYYFVNMEDHIAFFSNKDQYFFYTSTPADNSPDGELLKLQRVVAMNFGTTVDTMRDMNAGKYTRKHYELDILNRTHKAYEFDWIGANIMDSEYIDYYRDAYLDFPNFEVGHSDDMMLSHMNKWHRTYTIKDYPDQDAPNAPALRPKPYYGDIHTHKATNFLLFEEYKISLTIYGTNELVAGDIIYLEIPEFKTKQKVDEERSGYWLVETINNEFYENTYMQKLVVSRIGLNPRTEE